jgi:hypothetical protein
VTFVFRVFNFYEKKFFVFIEQFVFLYLSFHFGLRFIRLTGFRCRKSGLSTGLSRSSNHFAKIHFLALILFGAVLSVFVFQFAYPARNFCFFARPGS